MQLQTLEGIPCVFFPSIRNVLVIHSFCESAQAEIGSISVDISLTDLAKEIIDRSKNFVQEKAESDKKLIDENISDEKLKNLKGMNNSILAKLAKSNILNVNDFADLATFELIDKEEGILRELDLDEEIANNMIMEARSFWSEEQNKD